MLQLEERSPGQVRVWDQHGALILDRRIKDGDRLYEAARDAVAAARSLAIVDPRHVTIDFDGQRIVRVIDGSFLRDPREFLKTIEWPANPLLC